MGEQEPSPAPRPLPEPSDHQDDPDTSISTHPPHDHSGTTDASPTILDESLPGPDAARSPPPPDTRTDPSAASADMDHPPPACLEVGPRPLPSQPLSDASPAEVSALPNAEQNSPPHPTSAEPEEAEQSCLPHPTSAEPHEALPDLEQNFASDLTSAEPHEALPDGEQTSLPDPTSAELHEAEQSSLRDPTVGEPHEALPDVEQNFVSGPTSAEPHEALHDAEQSSLPDPTLGEPNDAEQGPRDPSSADPPSGSNPDPTPEVGEAEPQDEFAYLANDRDTFTGPLREVWDREQAERMRLQQEREEREAEEMAARAAAARADFFRRIEAERNANRRAVAPGPSPAEGPRADRDDLVGGWQQVMDMVGSRRDKVPAAKAKQFQKLYLSPKG